MIDTVSLKIKVAGFDDIGKPAWEITRKDLFEHVNIENTPGKNWHLWNKNDKNKPNEYLPHVEIWNFYSSYYCTYALYVRFSVPKLLYGNNLLEVNERQFPAVCKVLQKKLEIMGIYISLDAIKQAEVIQIHYSKNIICRGIPVSLLLKRLAMAKPPIGHMQIQKTTYLNSQQVIFHNKSREVCFYDKYQEILSDAMMRNKLTWLFKREDLKNIFRLEVRLNKKAALKTHFAPYQTISFQMVFREEYARAALTKYWDAIYASLQTVAGDFGAPEYLFEMLRQQGLSVGRCLREVALNSLVHSIGYSNSKQMLQKHGCPLSQVNNWSNIFQTKELPVVASEYDFLKIINDELKQFKWLGKYSWGGRRRHLLNGAPLTAESLLTVAEAAKYAKITERSLQKKLQNGEISGLRIGKLYRLRKEDFRALISSSRRP